MEFCRLESGCNKEGLPYTVTTIHRFQTLTVLVYLRLTISLKEKVCLP